MKEYIARDDIVDVLLKCQCKDVSCANYEYCDKCDYKPIEKKDILKAIKELYTVTKADICREVVCKLKEKILNRCKDTVIDCDLCPFGESSRCWIAEMGNEDD